MFDNDYNIYNENYNINNELANINYTEMRLSNDRTILNLVN